MKMFGLWVSIVTLVHYIKKVIYRSFMLCLKYYYLAEGCSTNTSSGLSYHGKQSSQRRITY